ncbi:hypothetical protein [Isoptericola sp. BMS4]|uniref:hypothetical protein n=1 Tax=Isoptericola sp. BMS4 TaxID=2527875 RepID=UPI00141FBDE1|nr:hypothetical protein [Isoptericola sp. BMS4]
MDDSTPGPQERDADRPPAYGQYAGEGYRPPTPPPGPRPAAGPGPGPSGDRVSVGRALGWAWASFARGAGAWIGAMLVVLMIGVAATVLLTPDLRVVLESYDDPDAVLDLVQAGATVTDILLTSLLAVVEIVLGAVLAHGALAATRSGRAAFGDFFALRNVGGIVALGVVNGLLTLLLAFVPLLGPLLRLVIAFFLSAALFYVIDAEQDAVTAMRSSVDLVRRNLGVAVATVVTVVLLGLAGFLLFVVGAFVTVPVAVLTGAFVYRRLVGQQVAPPG